MGVKSRRDISTPDPNLKKKKLRLTEEDLGTQSKKNKSAPLSEASESEENERNSETDREMDVDDDENDINDEDRESGENDMSSEEENELVGREFIYKLLFIPVNPMKSYQSIDLPFCDRRCTPKHRKNAPHQITSLIQEMMKK